MSTPDPVPKDEAAPGDPAGPSLERYLEAATRENTRRSYRQAVEHFEVAWGGLLPATPDTMARYLAAHADSHSIATLRQRLAALGRWHRDQGFPDPTRTPLVRQVLKGIRELHPARQRQARPLQLAQLEALVSWLDGATAAAENRDDRKAALAHRRDKALLLLGFWRAFRSDELSRLRVEHITVDPGAGMTLYLPRSKSDRDASGRSYRAPALSRLCPVEAYQAWTAAAFLEEGPVFRRINRWGQVHGQALHPGSIAALLRRLFRRAGLDEAEAYSSHSLRRGFATWASGEQWDVKSLMSYVGWQDVKSALRYIEVDDPFARRRIERALGRESD